MKLLRKVAPPAGKERKIGINDTESPLEIKTSISNDPESDYNIQISYRFREGKDDGWTERSGGTLLHCNKHMTEAWMSATDKDNFEYNLEGLHELLEQLSSAVDNERSR